MAESTRIGEESRVTLHFALKLEDGNVVDSTFDKQPASFKVATATCCRASNRRCSA